MHGKMATSNLSPAATGALKQEPPNAAGFGASADEHRRTTASAAGGDDQSVTSVGLNSVRWESEHDRQSSATATRRRTPQQDRGGGGVGGGDEDTTAGRPPPVGVGGSSGQTGSQGGGTGTAIGSKGGRDAFDKMLHEIGGRPPSGSSNRKAVAAVPPTKEKLEEQYSQMCDPYTIDGGVGGYDRAAAAAGGGDGGGGSWDDCESVASSQKSAMSQEEKMFYSAEENQHGDDNIWGLLSGVGGNVYEWYDFAVYGLLANEIGHCFFPKSSERLQLINSFGIYLAAFIMRPLGAILFGELGDRLVGRRNALVFSIVLITVPSVAMGMLPGYDTIGIFAPILLLILRMFQGLSVGGQLAGSYVLSIEQSTSKNRGFRGSVCDASSVGGFLLASAVTSVVRCVLDEETVDDWGWRIPFWFSLALAPMLFFIVNKTEESKFWDEANNRKETEEVIRHEEAQDSTPAFLDLLKSPFRRRQLLGVIGTLSVKTSSFYMLFSWTPIYLSSLRGILSEATADIITVFIISFYIVLLLIGGKLSDRFEHRMDLIRIGLPGIIVACPAMFGMFESESLAGVILGQLQYALCLSFVQGGMAAWEVELWMADPTLSFTGVAVGHNVAASLFGGTMPLVATYLFYWSDDLADNEDGEGDLFSVLIPGLYVSVLGFVSLWCISFVVRHPHDVRTGEAKIKKMWKKKNKSKSWDYGLREASLSICDSFGPNQLSYGGYVPPDRKGRLA